MLKYYIGAPLGENMKATDLRPGMIVLYEGELFRVTEAAHRTPGNKRAFIQGKLFRLKDGVQRECKFSSGDEIEKAHLDARAVQYLYNDSAGYHFMDTENYEQFVLNRESLGNAIHYLIPNHTLEITFHEGTAIGVELPPSMEFTVVETEPNLKNATATSSYKQAKIETGYAIKVPQFVETGDRIRVNPRTDEDLERGKK